MRQVFYVGVTSDQFCTVPWRRDVDQRGKSASFVFGS